MIVQGWRHLPFTKLTPVLSLIPIMVSLALTVVIPEHRAMSEFSALSGVAPNIPTAKIVTAYSTYIRSKLISCRNEIYNWLLSLNFLQFKKHFKIFYWIKSNTYNSVILRNGYVGFIHQHEFCSEVKTYSHTQSK